MRHRSASGRAPSSASPDSCVRLLDRLSAYLDHELTEEGCREVRRHMRRCSGCRSVFNTLRKTVDLCHKAGGPRPSKTASARMLRRLRLALAEGRSRG